MRSILDAALDPRPRSRLGRTMTVGHPDARGHAITRPTSQMFDAGEVPGIPGSREHRTHIEVPDNRTPTDATRSERARAQPRDGKGQFTSVRVRELVRIRNGKARR